MPKRLITLAVLLLAATGVARAETYTIDPIHSSIGFSVRHMAISKVRGNFNDFSGTFEYDANDTSNWAVEVEIQMASIDTRSEDRDAHLRSEDFFSVDSFPTMTFNSTGVVANKDGTFDLAGDLTMHGVTKPVTLAVEKIGEFVDGKGNKHVGFTATVTINRLDYGVQWSKTMETGGLLVGHDVDITLEIEAHQAEEEKKEDE